NALTGNKENGANNAAFRAMLEYKPNDQLKVLFNVHGGYVDNRPAEYRHIGDLKPDPSKPADSGATIQCSVAETNAGGCFDAFGYGTPSKFYNGSYNRQNHLKGNSLGSYLRADYSLGTLSFVSNSAVEHVDKIHPEDSDASPNQLIEIDFGVRSNTITQEFQIHQTKDRYNWVLGAYYLHEDLRQNQPISLLHDLDKVTETPGAGDGTYDPTTGVITGAYTAYDTSHQVTDAYAIYGQGDYSITEKLKLTLGGRVTAERKSFDYFSGLRLQQGGEGNFGSMRVLNQSSHGLHNTAFSWRAALNYSFTRDILGYASVATGFKSGGFNGSFLSSDPAQITAQLKPIDPETVTAYEVGVKTSLFDRRLILNLAAFYNDYKKMQVFLMVPEGSINVNLLTNAKAAHTEGVDIQALARPIENLTLKADVGLLDTRLDGAVNGQYVSNQLPLAPRLTSSMGFDYKIPLGDNAVNLQFNASYKSHQYFDTTNNAYTTQSGYWLENARVAYSFNNTRWEVAAYVHNLADQHYYVDAFDLTFVGLIQGVRGTPRTVGVEANYHF
ncbi:MAG: TonB-dependent receptor, partial [Caulobacteraceae bacterium]|nr:TonB-dependent receptor [Caulobacteraceae bacterium]